MRDEITKLYAQVDDVSKIIDQLTTELVEQYCSQLNLYMKHIDKRLVESETGNPLIDTEVETFILNLASILYFTGSAMESLGIKEDACKAIRSELYNKTREATQGTVADKDAAATLACQYETITLGVYSRSYRKVKLRIDAGYEMVSALKKVLTRRIAELELSNSRYIGKEGV